jgi:hypothetical protein
VDGDFEVVGVDGDRVEEFFDEDAAFLVGGGVPDSVEVEVLEDGEDVFELAGKFVLERRLVVGCGMFRSQGCDLSAEDGLLPVEKFRADAVLVVQLQEFALPVGEVCEHFRTLAGLVSAVVGGPAGVFQRVADSGLEFLVGGDEAESEEGGSEQAFGGASGLAASGASVGAAVHGVALPVLVDAHRSATRPASHPAREQIAAASLARAESTVRGVEFCWGDEWLVVAGVPDATEDHLAEVDARLEDAEHRRMVDPGAFADHPVTVSVGS